MFASRLFFLCFQDPSELLGVECVARSETGSFSNHSLLVPVKALSPMRTASFATQHSFHRDEVLITDQSFRLKVTGREHTQFC